MIAHTPLKRARLPIPPSGLFKSSLRLTILRDNSPNSRISRTWSVYKETKPSETPVLTQIYGVLQVKNLSRKQLKAGILGIS